MKTYAVTLLEVVPETPRDRTLALGVPDGAAAAFGFRPGQFVTVRDPAWHEGVRRAYSLSGSPLERGVLRITVRDDGRMGRHVHDLRAGAHLESSAPQGRFLLDAPPDRRVVLAAGGAGVAPYRAFLRFLRESGSTVPVALLASARTSEEVLFRAELDRLAREAGWFTYVPTVTREPDGTPWTGRRGRFDADAVRAAVGDPRHVICYACGPTAFVDAMVLFVHAAGVPDAHVHRERWG
jgi:ferredoxin-NADP reductase